MSRKEFMDRLEKLLWNISDSEREEALQYYNDYFDDAGEENEAEVIRELVSPEQVAQKIKAGLSDSASEFSEQGYRDTRFDAEGRGAVRRTGRQPERRTWPERTGAAGSPEKGDEFLEGAGPRAALHSGGAGHRSPWHRAAGGGPLPGGGPSGAGRRNRGVRNRGSDFRNFRHRRGQSPRPSRRRQWGSRWPARAAFWPRWDCCFPLSSSGAALRWCPGLSGAS